MTSVRTVGNGARRVDAHARAFRQHEATVAHHPLAGDHHIADVARRQAEQPVPGQRARIERRRRPVVEDDQIGLNIEGEDDVTVYFPFAWIVDAKLVLTDELMKRGADARAARVDAENDNDLSESEED